MFYFRNKQFIVELMRLFLAVFGITAILMRPQSAILGVLNGLRLCSSTIIPALFPFLVLSKIILNSPLAFVPGFFLRPYTKLLGISSKKASSALLLGMIGGYISGAAAINYLLDDHEISPRQSELLLCCCVNAGPGFAISAVGTVLLGNSLAGWALFASLCIASLLTGLLMRLLLFRNDAALPLSATKKSSSQSIVSMIQSSVTATLMLCGFVTFFSFIVFIVIPPSADIFWRCFLATGLEVGTACSFAAQSDLSYKIYFCCAALSFGGLSILLQMRAILSARIKLMPYILSRFAHFSFSFVCLKLILHFCPMAIPTGSDIYSIAVQMPVDTVLVIFVLLCLIFCAFPARSSLLNHKNAL